MYIKKDYIIQGEIGNGSTSKVFKTIKKDTKKEYALKIIPKKKIQGIQSNRLAAEIDVF